LYQKVEQPLFYLKNNIIFTKKTKKMKWISVKDELPENDFDENIVSYKHNDYRIVTVASYDSETNTFKEVTSSFSYQIDNVTHWMPLPEPPKQ
jgi:hypothetical protein